MCATQNLSLRLKSIEKVLMRIEGKACQSIAKNFTQSSVGKKLFAKFSFAYQCLCHDDFTVSDDKSVNVICELY